MKSYILGDLDIEEDLDDSFEISSNSSASKGKQILIKKFIEDEDEGYLGNEAFQGFIAKQSPFSFKNPIFFSCPNTKFT